MIVGGYCMHAYCEVCNAFTENGACQTEAQAASLIRRKGWKLDVKNQKAWCPNHTAPEWRDIS